MTKRDIILRSKKIKIKFDNSDLLALLSVRVSEIEAEHVLVVPKEVSNDLKFWHFQSYSWPPWEDPEVHVICRSQLGFNVNKMIRKYDLQRIPMAVQSCPPSSHAQHFAQILRGFFSLLATASGRWSLGSERKQCQCTATMQVIGIGIHKLVHCIMQTLHSMSLYHATYSEIT